MLQLFTAVVQCLSSHAAFAMFYILRVTF